jgi:hypothetical protein
MISINDFLSGKLYEIVFGILAVILLYGLSGIFINNIAWYILRLFVFLFKFPILLTIRLFRYCCNKNVCKLCGLHSVDIFKSKCCKTGFHVNCVSKVLTDPPKCPNCKLFIDSKFYEIAVYSKLEKIKSS